MRHAGPALVALALFTAGCATNRVGADVTRFHLNQPIARGAVFLEPADPAQAQGLEFRQYAAAIADRLRTAGFQPVESRAAAELIGVVQYGQTTRAGLAGGGSPVSVGIGGGGFGGGRRSGVGGGVGLSFPIGKPKNRDVAVSQLAMTLRRKSDSTTVWEGRASTEVRADARYGALSEAVPLLADALLRDFPGPSGTTTRYTPEA